MQVTDKVLEGTPLLPLWKALGGKVQDCGGAAGFVPWAKLIRLIEPAYGESPGRDALLIAESTPKPRAPPSQATPPSTEYEAGRRTSPSLLDNAGQAPGASGEESGEDLAGRDLRETRHDGWRQAKSWARGNEKGVTGVENRHGVRGSTVEDDDGKDKGPLSITSLSPVEEGRGGRWDEETEIGARKEEQEGGRGREKESGEARASFRELWSSDSD